MLERSRVVGRCGRVAPPARLRTSHGSGGSIHKRCDMGGERGRFSDQGRNLAESSKLFVASIEREEPLATRSARAYLTEELEELVNRAESNPNAILYGLFHTYKFNEG